jgi:voltage-gated potassium channel
MSDWRGNRQHLQTRHITYYSPGNNMKPIKMTFFPSFTKMPDQIDKRKYMILLVSFLILIFGNTFTENVQLFGIVNVYQNLLAGLLVFFNKKRLRYMILCIIIISAVLDLFANDFSFIHIKSWHGILYLIFFTLVVIEVYKEVLYVKTVSTEMLSAALCGFVLLCQIATFLFYLIDIYSPHSFANTGEAGNILMNLNYFSFTTLLTIGFGDIVPLSVFAKRAVMFIGLMGHFYTVFVIGIIIGKYISANKSNPKENVVTPGQD